MARYPLPPAEPMKLTTLAEIAKGGMGSVEMARASGGRLDGKVMAIKRLNPEVAQDPTFVNMFLDEAWMTSAIESPNVIRVEAWGQEENNMFLAVELVQGVSLSRLIKESRAREEPFAERTVANIGSQLCAGMHAAHSLRGPDGQALGLVHRDLTPGNVLVSFDGIVKIADFGIAQAEERLTHTRTGMMKGKPAYMAPEQARGGRVDARADIFSFGVLMFELLSGRRPWTAKSAFDVLMEVATKRPPPLAQLRATVHPVFSQIVDRCLGKKPADRFDSALDIQVLLDGWRREKGFEREDQQSLSLFVQRNTPRQMKWFENALGGTREKDAPTFKDLEQNIDEQRDGPKAGLHRRAPAPAAGRPAQHRSDPGLAAVPSEAMQRLAAMRPSSSHRLAAVSGPTQTGSQLPAAAQTGQPRVAHAHVTPQPAPSPGPPRAPGTGLSNLASTQLITPEEAAARVAAPSAPPSQQKSPQLLQTEMLATSPFRRADASAGMPQITDVRQSGAMPAIGQHVVAMAPTDPSPPELALPPARKASAMPHRNAAAAGSLPLPPSSEAAKLAANVDPRAVTEPGGPGYAQPNAGPSQPSGEMGSAQAGFEQPPPPADVRITGGGFASAGPLSAPIDIPKKSLAGPIIVGLLVIVLAGCGIGYWRFGHLLGVAPAASEQGAPPADGAGQDDGPSETSDAESTADEQDE